MCSLTFSLSNIERHASQCGLGTGEVSSPKLTVLKSLTAAAKPSCGVTIKAADASPKTAPSSSRPLFGTVKRKQDEDGKERHQT